MNYKVFVKLYASALEYANVDYYIAERGWEAWMDEYTSEQENDATVIVRILEKIYELAHSTITNLRGSISRAEFSRIYNIPIRTLENWDSQVRREDGVQTYLLMLISYTILLEFMGEEDDEKN